LPTLCGAAARLLRCAAECKCCSRAFELENTFLQPGTLQGIDALLAAADALLAMALVVVDAGCLERRCPATAVALANERVHWVQGNAARGRLGPFLPDILIQVFLWYAGYNKLLRVVLGCIARSSWASEIRSPDVAISTVPLCSVTTRSNTSLAADLSILSSTTTSVYIMVILHVANHNEDVSPVHQSDKSNKFPIVYPDALHHR
jgi:hypothetical protein